MLDRICHDLFSVGLHMYSNSTYLLAPRTHVNMRAHKYTVHIVALVTVNRNAMRTAMCGAQIRFIISTIT